MKGSLAACVGACAALVRAGARHAGDILLAAVADEEHSSLGTMDIAARYTVDGAIVTEPTSLRICLAHKGFEWIEVVTHGRAAHGSRPDLGIDANMRMGRVLAGLERLSERLASGRRHALVGPASLHAALLEGGTGLSTYAAESRLSIERRTIPGETREQVEAEIAGILDELRRADASFQATTHHILSRPPFEARSESPLVATLARAATAVLGSEPEFVGETPWMDSALLAAAGADTVVMGPHGEGAHAAVEWVDLASVHALAKVLAQTAIEYCA
jgi:acetylornithine deacetylase